MKRAIRLIYRILTGKTDAELARDWSWHLYATRSRIKAYWLTLVS